jgi:GxxExxY protein
MGTRGTLPSATEDTASACVDCGFHVHKELGPGFKEVIYRRAFCLELDSRGIRYECEKPIVVRFKQWEIPGQRVDLIVEGRVVVEIKVVPDVKALHRLQVLSYLKTMDLQLGLVMNFNGALFKHGVRRVVL